MRRIIPSSLSRFSSVSMLNKPLPLCELNFCHYANQTSVSMLSKPLKRACIGIVYICIVYMCVYIYIYSVHIYIYTLYRRADI